VLRFGHDEAEAAGREATGAGLTGTMGVDGAMGCGRRRANAKRSTKLAASEARRRARRRDMGVSVWAWGAGA